MGSGRQLLAEEPDSLKGYKVSRVSSRILRESKGWTYASCRL